MKNPCSTFVSVALVLGAMVPVAHAAVNVERQGSENPVIEVTKSAVWGGLGGLVVGGALALVSDSNDNDGDIVRWCFVGGTFLGLGYGIYHVASRPKATALLEFEDGSPHLRPALPVPDPDRGLLLRLVAVRF
jgi:hypothetical protein